MSTCRPSRVREDCDSPPGPGHKLGPPRGTAGSKPRETEKVLPSVRTGYVVHEDRLVTGTFCCIKCCVRACVCTQSCLSLCDPTDCSPPGSSVHGILQARILEWVPCPPPGDLPDPGMELGSPAHRADSLPSVPPGRPKVLWLTKQSGSLQGCFLPGRGGEDRPLLPSPSPPCAHP